MSEIYFENTLWKKTFVESLKLDKKTEKIGILNWTDDEKLLLHNLNKLICGNFDLILSELTPFEIHNSINLQKLNNLKNYIRYIPPQIKKDTVINSNFDKILVISDRKSPYFDCYNIVIKNENIDLLEINNRKDILKYTNYHKNIIIDLNNNQYVNYLLLNFFDQGLNIKVVNRNQSLHARLLSNGIILENNNYKTNSIRKFFKEFLTSERSNVNFFNKQNFEIIKSIEDYKGYNELTLNKSFNKLVCFKTILNDFPYLNKDIIDNRSIRTAKFYTYENASLWHCVQLLYKSDKEFDSTINIIISELLDYIFLDQNHLQNEFYLTNLLSFIHHNTNFNIIQYILNLNASSTYKKDNLYHVFKCFIFSCKLYNKPNDYKQLLDFYLKSTIKYEKPGAKFKYYSKFIEFSHDTDSNKRIINEILESKYQTGINNFLYLLPSYVDIDLFHDSLPQDHLSGLNRTFLGLGIMRSYGIWEDNLDLCDISKIKNCIQTFRYYKITNLEYFILSIYSKETFSQKDLFSSLSAFEKFGFLLFLNRINDFDSFNFYLSSFKDIPNFFDFFKHDIRTISLLNRANYYPEIRHIIDSISIDNYTYDENSLPYIIHYFNTLNKDIPENFFDANITSSLASYSFIPVIK